MSALFPYRWWLTGLLGIMLVAGFPYAKKAIEPNNAISIWFNQSDPALQAHFAFQKEFGNDRVIAIAFKAEGGILQPKLLREIQQLSGRLEDIQGVKSVSSILNARDFRRVREDSVTRIRLARFFDDSSDFDLTAGEKKEIMSSPLVVKRFINEAGDVALLTVTLRSSEEVEQHLSKIIDDIKAAAQIFPGADKVHLAGIDVVNKGLNELSRRDFKVFTFLGFALMFMICGLFYRDLKYLLLVVCVCGLAVLASLELHGLMGYRLHIFTVICPPLLITLGLIAVMHIINEHEHLMLDHPGADSKLLAQQTLRNIFKPALFATLTTITGFISLLTSPTAALREFSILSTSGSVFLFLFSMLFASLLLPFRKGKSLVHEDRTGAFMSRMSAYIIKHSVLFSTVSISLLVISVIGTLRIRNDLFPLSYFPEKHRIVKDHEFLQTNWGPYHQLDMVINTKDSVDLKDPVLISGILRFKKELHNSPLVAASFDYTTLMERYVQVTWKNKKLEDILGDPLIARRFIEQFMTKLQEQPTGLITHDLRKARVTVIGPVLTVRQLEKNMQPVEAAARAAFGDKADLSIAGYPSLHIKIMNYAFDSMKSGLYSALILVFISMVLMLRNVRMALIALAPNVFPVVLLLGFLGISGIYLDLATCTATSIVMGIAIDDTIYFLNKFQEYQKKGGTLMECIENTHKRVGKVILISSLVMIAGYSVMLVASLKTVIYFGLLSIVAVFAAVLGDLIVLPLLLKAAGLPKVRNTNAITSTVSSLH